MFWNRIDFLEKKYKYFFDELANLLSPFKEYIKSITTDNGTEFACHEMISKSLGVTIYFADPYASWQKGAIENVNGLFRQYVPKKKRLNMSAISKSQNIQRKFTWEQERN